LDPWLGQRALTSCWSRVFDRTDCLVESKRCFEHKLSETSERDR